MKPAPLDAVILGLIVLVGACVGLSYVLPGPLLAVAGLVALVALGMLLAWNSQNR